MEKKILETDVCVIGAGPAGSVASIFLSREKINHIVVDAASFPRHKACGDIYPSQVLRILNEINPDILAELRKKKLIQPIIGTNIYPTGGNSIKFDFLPLDGNLNEPGCYGMSRYDFDLVLVNEMKKNNYSQLKENFLVTEVIHHQDYIEIHSKENEIIRAKIIIAACGSNSPLVDKYFGFQEQKKHFAIGIRAYFEGVDFNEFFTELFVDKTLMPGGFYISPLPNGVCNANLVVLNDVHHFNMRETFEAFIKSNPLLKEKFKSAKQIGNYSGSPLFLGLKNHIISGNRFMVIGDSAGLIDVITGNGIPQAMESGKRAALKARDALVVGDFSKAFLEEFEKSLYKKLENSLALGKLAYPIIHRKYLNGFILNSIKFISNRKGINTLIRELIYAKNEKKKLLSPRLYINFLLGR
ncbi:MAG: FAD-dependent monooxygenase [Bacteroidetes bacterium]|nr:FAD-dependent monooxygenase [Bacteroidota bacterium]